MRAADAPNPSAIPNFQTVHQDFSFDAVPNDFSEETTCLVEDPEVAFYRGGQPTAEGRAWMVSRGFKTVVDLRFEDRDNQWTRPVGAARSFGKLGGEPGGDSYPRHGHGTPVVRRRRAIHSSRRRCLEATHVRPL